MIEIYVEVSREDYEALSNYYGGKSLDFKEIDNKYYVNEELL